MFNNTYIICIFILFAITMYFFTLKSLYKKNIKYQVLYFLPLVLIFDIPINYLLQGGKGAVTLRIWNLYTIFIMIIYIKDVFGYLSKWRKYLLLFYFILIIHLAINNFDVAIIRGYVKVIFSYLPLILSIKVYVDKLDLKEQIKSIIGTSYIIIALDVIQVVAYKFLGINLYVQNLFHKPSATFSEPVWNGIFLAFIFILIQTTQKKKLLLYIVGIAIVFSGTKAAILFICITYLLTSKKWIIKIGLLAASPITIIYLIQANIYSMNNLKESFYIHTANWIIAIDTYMNCNIFQKIFGVGFGQIIALAARQQNFDDLIKWGYTKNSIGLTLNTLGGDCANIIIEIITTFGLIGIVLFIVYGIKFMKKIKDNILMKRIYVLFMTVSLIHPLYFMGIGIFFICFVIFNNKQLEIGKDIKI